MNRKIIKVVVTVIFCHHFNLLAQAWTQASAPNVNWWSIASSADGSKLIATTAAGLECDIYISTNYGQTWFPSYSLPVADGSAVCSADGTVLAVLGFGNTNNLCISTNTGASWVRVTNATSGRWAFITMPADGHSLLAAEPSSSEILTSTNFGATWTQQVNAPILANGSQWILGASPANGTKLVAISSGPPSGNTSAVSSTIYCSTNGGMDWTQSSLRDLNWTCIASSADGSVLAVASAFEFAANLYTNHTSIYVSTNFGASWTTNVFSDDEIIYSLASSADGKTLLAGPGPIFYQHDPVFISTNFGTIWVTAGSPTNYWHSVYSSADGGRLTAVVPSGGIWLAQSTPQPQLQLTSGGSSLNVTWTLPSANFVLQQCPDLAMANWSIVTNEPALNLSNLQNQVLLPAPAGNVFFRLRTP